MRDSMMVRFADLAVLAVAVALFVGLQMVRGDLVDDCEGLMQVNGQSCKNPRNCVGPTMTCFTQVDAGCDDCNPSPCKNEIWTHSDRYGECGTGYYDICLKCTIQYWCGEGTAYQFKIGDVCSGERCSFRYAGFFSGICAIP